MPSFDEELENLENTLDSDEELHTARKRFEQSELWQEHRKFHEENGGTPKLVTWEEPEKIAAQPQEQEQARHTRMVSTGGCECQPRVGFMQISEKGDIVPGVPGTEATEIYGTVSSSTTTEYSGKPGPSDTYASNPSLTRDLYK